MIYSRREWLKAEWEYLLWKVGWKDYCLQCDEIFTWRACGRSENHPARQRPGIGSAEKFASLSTCRRPRPVEVCCRDSSRLEDQ
jgi:hypothetical protein